MANDPIGNKNISEFPMMPNPSTLYMGYLLGNYKETEDSAWCTGLISLSSIGGGNVGEYLASLVDYCDVHSPSDISRAHWVLGSPTFENNDSYYWVDINQFNAAYFNAHEASVSGYPSDNQLFIRVPDTEISGTDSFGFVNAEHYLGEYVSSYLSEHLSDALTAYGEDWWDDKMNSWLTHTDKAYQIYEAISQYIQQ